MEPVSSDPKSTLGLGGKNFPAKRSKPLIISTGHQLCSLLGYITA